MLNNVLKSVREILLNHGFELADEGKYEQWRKKECHVWIYVQKSDRFCVTFLNITISKRGYSQTVVVTKSTNQFEQTLRKVDNSVFKFSKEVLAGKTHLDRRQQ